jgi:hypothetical protein
MTTKNSVKRVFQKLSFSRLPPLVTASMGRSGSTLVFDAVSEGLAHSRFPFFNHSEFSMRLVVDSLWYPSSKTTINGVSYKTHALGDELPRRSPAKCIFVFGKASDAALSVISCRERYGDAWIKEHLEHLRAKETFDQISDKDILRFGEQIDSWRRRSDLDRLFIKYDALWENQDKISDFCGFSIQLPPRRERSGTVNHDDELVARIRQTYSDLDKKIAEMPAIELLKAEIKS